MGGWGLEDADPIQARIASGLDEARRKGKILGRPKRTVLAKAKLLEKHRDVVRLLRANHSVRNAAKISGKGGSTVQRVKAALVKMSTPVDKS